MKECTFSSILIKGIGHESGQGFRSGYQLAGEHQGGGKQVQGPHNCAVSKIQTKNTLGQIAQDFQQIKGQVKGRMEGRNHCIKRLKRHSQFLKMGKI